MKQNINEPSIVDALGSRSANHYPVVGRTLPRSLPDKGIATWLDADGPSHGGDLIRKRSDPGMARSVYVPAPPAPSVICARICARDAAEWDATWETPRFGVDVRHPLAEVSVATGDRPGRERRASYGS